MGHKMVDQAYDLNRYQKSIFSESKNNINLRTETLAFDDVLLVPQYSEVESRANVNLSQNLDLNIKLNIPIISSPMDTITEAAMARTMHELGGIGIIHRYNSISEQAEMVHNAIPPRPLG